MKRLYITLIVGALFAAGVSQAQTQRQLTLAEAIQLGLENSKQMDIALSKARGAEAATDEMKDKQLPDFDISGQYLRFNQPSVSLGQGLAGEDSGDGGGGDGGMEITPKYLMMGQATLEIPLFSGFRIRNGIQSSKYLEKAASLDAESQRSEVVLNIIGAYANLYKAQQAVALVKENLAKAQQRVEDFTNLEANGIIARNDLLSAQLLESNTSLALLDAENSTKVANFNMNLLLGIDESLVLVLEDPASLALPDLQTLGTLRDEALSERKDLLAMDERSKATETAIKIAKGEYYPSVGLSAGYIMADMDQIVKLTNAANVGVGVSYNLSTLFKNGSRVRQAKEQHLQTQLAKSQMEDKVKSEVFKSFSDYQQSIQRIEVYEKAKLQASENYRIVKDKYDNSLVTTTELLDADVDQFQAELNLDYAQVDAVMAYCKLLEAAGQLDADSLDQLNSDQ